MVVFIDFWTLLSLTSLTFAPLLRLLFTVDLPVVAVAAAALLLSLTVVLLVP